METERNRSCKTGFNKSSAVDRRRSSIRSGTERLLFQDRTRKRKELALKSALTTRVEAKKFIVLDELKFDADQNKRIC